VVGKVFCVGAKGKETAAWQAVINWFVWIISRCLCI
jgi:hypothetical protein